MAISLRVNYVTGGYVAAMILCGVVLANAESTGGSKPNAMSGGTQGAQEQMYEDRMKEVQESQTSQSMKKPSAIDGAGTMAGPRGGSDMSSGQSTGSMNEGSGTSEMEKRESGSKSPAMR